MAGEKGQAIRAGDQWKAEWLGILSRRKWVLGVFSRYEGGSWCEVGR